MSVPFHISVVIPAYNEEVYLGPCLAALQEQSRKPDMIYIVDNNSTDRTREIAESYSNVQVMEESKQGICAATKTGLDAAVVHNGIILRCDADCRPKKSWIADMETSFAENPRVAAVSGPGTPYDVNILARILFKWFYMKPYFTLVGLALGHTPLFGSNLGIRASAWREISETTHLREHQDIHDDIDISYHVSAEILYVHELSMPISARPFSSPFKLPTRYIAGFKSIFIHWPEQAPWRLNR